VMSLLVGYCDGCNLAVVVLVCVRDFVYYVSLECCIKSGKRVCAVSNAGILEMRGSETVRAHICKAPHYAINHRGPAFKKTAEHLSSLSAQLCIG